MPSDPSRPLLNPVLKFTKAPRPKSVTGGGKNAKSISAYRLPKQRQRLNAEFRELAATAANRPQFNDRVIVYAAMFDDSLAASYTPRDFFEPERGARLVAPYRSGYLVEVQAKRLRTLAIAALEADRVADKVDISRIQSVRFFSDEDATGLRDLDETWRAAPKVDGGRAFLAWFMPFHDDDAGEEQKCQDESLDHREIP